MKIKKYEKKLEEEPSNQYGISIFKEIYWVASYETVADNTERSKNYRKFTYATLNSINTNKLANLSKILIRSKNKKPSYLAPFATLEALLTQRLITYYVLKKRL